MIGIEYVLDTIRRRIRSTRDLITTSTHTCAADDCTNNAAPFADHEVRHGQYVCSAKCMGRVIRPALNREHDRTCGGGGAEWISSTPQLEGAGRRTYRGECVRTQV